MPSEVLSEVRVRVTAASGSPMSRTLKVVVVPPSPVSLAGEGFVTSTPVLPVLLTVLSSAMVKIETSSSSWPESHPTMTRAASSSSTKSRRTTPNSGGSDPASQTHLRMAGSATELGVKLTDPTTP